MNGESWGADLYMLWTVENIAWNAGTSAGADLYIIPGIDMVNHSTDPSARNTSLQRKQLPAKDGSGGDNGEDAEATASFFTLEAGMLIFWPSWWHSDIFWRNSDLPNFCGIACRNLPKMSPFADSVGPICIGAISCTGKSPHLNQAFELHIMACWWHSEYKGVSQKKISSRVQTHFWKHSHSFVMQKLILLLAVSYCTPMAN